MPDINVNVNDQQNVISASAGIYPTLLVDVDHEENTVSVTVEKQTPVVDVQVIGRGPVGPAGPPGQDGQDGADGEPGPPGADGKDGKDGKDGQDGADGEDGQDGVSPAVTITSITGGHRVTITDADHPLGQSFDVMDGQDGQGAVDSVNGYTGTVVLDAEDVGALPDSTVIPTAVSQLTNDAGYITGYTETDPTVPSWAKASSKPSYTKSEVGLGNVDNVQQYSADNPPPYPVSSVNGQTGAVSVPTLSLLDVYPVGSIYMSVNSTSPAILFGGTWQQIEDTFLLAAGTSHAAGSTGGEENHTLIEAELPVVSGSVEVRPWGSGAQVYSPSGAFATENGSSVVGSGSSGTSSPSRVLSMTFGSGQSHNNMPPYLAVYVWKRTA